MAWNAEISMSGSSHGDGMIHVIGRIGGDTQADALDGAKTVLSVIADGKTAYIRHKPEGITDTDFDTKEVLHRGYVRFTVRNEPGNWIYPNDEPTVIPSLGDF